MLAALRIKSIYLLLQTNIFLIVTCLSYSRDLAEERRAHFQKQWLDSCGELKTNADMYLKGRMNELKLSKTIMGRKVFWYGR